MTIHVGTSGWHYQHWVGPFYPPDISAKDMLAFYAREFGSVEVNNSFYRLPTPETVADWRDSTPESFLFAFKASRYLTHMKKLKDPAEALDRTLGAASGLGRKLGPVLFQLPPKWRVDVERLTQFLGLLPGDIRAAFEFRDKSWFHEAVYAALREHGAALCVYDLEGERSPAEVTADFVYVRLHGPASAYAGSYDEHALSRWAKTAGDWHETGTDVYVFFNNDPDGHAVANARDLKSMLSG